MSIIQDGTGKSYGAKVDGTFRLYTDSRTSANIFFVSRDNKQAYNSISTVASAAAGEYVLYLKNDNAMDLFVEHIEYHSEQSVRWKVWEVTGTASGGTITPSNVNLGSSNAAEVTCVGNQSITGLTTVKQIGTHRTQAEGEGEMGFGGALIIPTSKAIAIEYDGGTTGDCEIDLFFYFQ